MKRFISIAAITLAGAICMPAGAQAAFGINDFDVSFTAPDGSPSMQAGSHPFAFTTSLAMNLSGAKPEGRLRELFVEEIPGLVVDGTAYPRCRAEDFETLKEGANDCSPASAVGVSESAFGEPDNRITAPVYNLVPPPGVLMRLGFRVADSANVIADVELSPKPPYTAIVNLGEIPEAVELFGLQLQLWGNPASPAHDEMRGICAVAGGVCPAAISQRPLLTLPTSCEGPQATYYEALSWEGDEDWGSALTHDGAGDPMGFFGCHRLDFGPFLSAEPTTKAAQSPTGLDLELEVFDEGLENPGGLAQSQIRDLELALPKGMTPSPIVVKAGETCSEEDLEAEASDSLPGEGCPAASGVGTAKVESPLLTGEPISGVIYRAEPYENFAGDAAMAFYVVLKRSDLGIVVTQPVGFEMDAPTGQLIALAEDMPQLPFSDLRLHLDGGESAPFVSPASCGNYEMEAGFATWSGEGPFIVTSSFPIVSGPDGGPCPTGGGDTQSGASTLCGACPSAFSPAGSLHRVHPKRRCPKGKRRVRREGKARCVKRKRGKQKEGRRHLR